MRSPIKYAKSGGVHIAYRVAGAGPIDLLLAPGFISHVELQMRHPLVARFAERLSSVARLITFDKRGTGLSDPVTAAASLEERMDDMRAVLDAVGSEKTALAGWSEGGPMSILFAAAYPGRTTSLILYGSMARTMWAHDYPMGVTEDQLAGLNRMIARWGDGVGLSSWAPSLASDEASVEWWSEMQRASASPGMIKALMEMYPRIDVRSVLPSIRVPTLVLHRRGDRICPIENGRYLAKHIPGARLVELNGADHNFYAGNSDEIIDEIEEFLTGVRHQPEHDRSLLTVLFIDIVGSTEHLERLGDAGWKSVLERFNASVRTILLNHRGREIDNAGDGFFVAFDGPARAVRCAVSLRDAANFLGLEIRAGVHTGECITLGPKVAGAAVHVGARVMNCAQPGEILVSSTVKDLVLGSGLEFSEFREVALKGFADTWRVAAVLR